MCILHYCAGYFAADKYPGWGETGFCCKFFDWLPDALVDKDGDVMPDDANYGDVPTGIDPDYGEYSINDAGENGCSCEADDPKCKERPILSASMCEAAAYSIADEDDDLKAWRQLYGYYYDGYYYGEGLKDVYIRAVFTIDDATPTRPSGCYVYGDGDSVEVRFNRHSVGGGDADARSICLKKRTVADVLEEVKQSEGGADSYCTASFAAIDANREIGGDHSLSGNQDWAHEYWRDRGYEMLGDDQVNEDGSCPAEGPRGGWTWLMKDGSCYESVSEGSDPESFGYMNAHWRHGRTGL